jgi:predicted small lipoprotein YifL
VIWHVVGIRPRCLVTLLVLAVGLAGCGRGPTSPVDKVAATRRAQAERVARDAGLPDEVQRFLARAAGAVAEEFTVAYRGSDGSVTTLVQRPPNRRVDVADGSGSTESLLRLGTGTFACRRDSAASAWTCRKQPAGAGGPDPDLGVFSPARIADTVSLLTSVRGAYTFSVVSRTVVGAKASCLLTQPAKGGAADELCIAGTGALLRVHTAQQTVEATRYRDRADGAVFKLPAAA